MSWFERLLPSRIRTEGGNNRNVPAGLWVKCPGCGAVLYRSELERNFDVCPKCSHHMRQNAAHRGVGQDGDEWNACGPQLTE